MRGVAKEGVASNGKGSFVLKRYTVCVDFDGVIHRYDTPWINAYTIPDEPVDGAIEWLHRTIQRFEVAIFTTRAKSWRGRRAVRAWLRKHSGNLWWGAPRSRGIEEVSLPKTKPPALVYIDDRGYRFTGSNWPSAEEVHRLLPWHKEQRAD